MIRGELHTPFRWYDDVLKQNRYRDYCSSVCNFKLITPCDRFLPFQIKTEEDIFTLNQWLIYDDEGNQVADLSICIPSNIEVKQVQGSTYITFEDASLTNCGFVLECGAYYSMITDGTTYFYSEVFEVVDFSETDFSQELFQPKLPWRFYDNNLKINKEKTNCKVNCDFILLSSDEALLPFQFRRLSSGASVDEFYLDNLEDDNCGVTLEVGLINIVTIDGYDYFIYNGVNISGLTPGLYQAIIVSGSQTFYSEPIKIICDLGEGNFLLQENNYKILQENNGGILLEP